MMIPATPPRCMLTRVLLLPTAPGFQTMVMPLPVPRLTIDMLDDFPDDGTRYELLEGMLLVTPAPSLAHQVVATRLAATLTSALRGSGAIVVAVGAIQRGKHTQLQPDVLVCPPGVRPTLNWRDVREWWLAVEVLSPSSRLYDREVKRGAYLALGVQEYWIADPGDCSVERWSATDSQGVRATTELIWQPAALDRAIAIDLGELFDGVCDDAEGAARAT
jgi:Uma2 family endonuclease